MAYTIKSIVDHHNKSSLRRLDFDCGDNALNDYIKRYSWKNDTVFKSAKVFVVTPDDNPKQIIGYYTSSASEITIELLPSELQSGFPRKIPCLLLGRLAVDTRHTEQGIGRKLLKHFFVNSVDISNKTGVFAVYTQAKNQKAFDYYLKNALEVLSEKDKLLYLPIKTISKAIDTN